MLLMLLEGVLVIRFYCIMIPRIMIHLRVNPPKANPQEVRPTFKISRWPQKTLPPFWHDKSNACCRSRRDLSHECWK